VKDVEIRKRLMETLHEKNYQEMITILLEQYYDPRYDYARQEYEGEFFDIFAENPIDAAAKIAAKLDELSFLPLLAANKQ